MGKGMRERRNATMANRLLSAGLSVPPGVLYPLSPGQITVVADGNLANQSMMGL
jgi:hypothetical protein